MHFATQRRSTPSSSAEGPTQTHRAVAIPDASSQALVQKRRVAIFSTGVAANALVQMKAKIKVESQAKIKHKPDGGNETEKTGAGTNEGGAMGEAQIQAHPQTRKLLNGYAARPGGANKFVCAEPHALGDAVSTVPATDEITNITVTSKLGKDLPMRYRTEPKWMAGGYYNGITAKGESIRRCPTCVTLLGDADSAVTKDYSK